MGNRNTLLIADDYEFNRLLLSEMFPERKIIEVSNGADAILEYEQHKDEICAVLTDVMMPKIDGLGLLDYLYKNKHVFETPVFVISADSSNKVITTAFKLGAEDFITKPFNTSFAKKHIDHIIELFELRRRMKETSNGEFDDELE